MGRWSASHWKTAVFGWLAFVVLAVFIGMQVGTKTLNNDDATVGQSHKANQILKKAFPQVDPQTEMVLVQSSTRTIDDPKFRATVNDVRRDDPVESCDQEPEVPARPGQHGQGVQERPLGDCHMGHEG